MLSILGTVVLFLGMASVVVMVSILLVAIVRRMSVTEIEVGHKHFKGVYRGRSSAYSVKLPGWEAAMQKDDVVVGLKEGSSLLVVGFMDAAQNVRVITKEDPITYLYVPHRYGDTVKTLLKHAEKYWMH